MQTPHSTQWISASAGIALCLSLAIWLGYPACQSAREQRAAAAATRHLVQGNYAAASLCARRALRFNSNNIPACRVLADLEERAISPRVLRWRQRLVSLEPGNVSNALALARTALQFDQLKLAANALAGITNLAAQDNTNACYHALAGQLAFAQNDFIAAERHLVAAVALEPAALAHPINLEIVRLHSPDTNVVQGARARLGPARGDPVHGTAILRALSNEALVRHDLDVARALSWELQSRSDSGFPDRLLHLTILARRITGQAQADRVFWATLAGAQTEAMTNPNLSAQLLHWLATHGFAEAGLDWLDQFPESLRADNAVRRAETECYVAARKWRELTTVLQLSHWGPNEHLRHALLALAWRQTGDDAMARIEWKRAVRTGFSGSTAVLVRLAGAWQWEKEAEELLWDISRDGPDRRWALALLCRAYELTSDTPSLRRVYDQQLATDCRDLVAKNNLAAASLLVCTNLAAAHEFAREVFQAQPTNAAFACTYAFSLHLQGRTKDALTVFKTLSEESRRAPAIAAYYGLLLQSQGAVHDAKKYFALALASPTLLLPEEHALVRSALGAAER